MTIIVCFKATDCVVIAADSRTSIGASVSNNSTQKIHLTGSSLATTSCGLARVNGKPWSCIMPEFVPKKTCPADIVDELRDFLDKIIGSVKKNNFGACRGGNKFLAACYDGSGFSVYKIERCDDDRKFNDKTCISNASSQSFITFLGDTSDLCEFIKSLEIEYLNKINLNPIDAVNFAENCIKEIIKNARKTKTKSIGGNFISICVVMKNSTTLHIREYTALFE